MLECVTINLFHVAKEAKRDAGRFSSSTARTRALGTTSSRTMEPGPTPPANDELVVEERPNSTHIELANRSGDAAAAVKSGGGGTARGKATTATCIQYCPNASMPLHIPRFASGAWF